MADDDDAVRARLAALEAEVKADAASQRARKEAALAKVRAERAAQLAEQQALRERQAALHARPDAARGGADDERSAAPRRGDRLGLDDLGGALDLARRADGVRAELARAPRPGEKSWLASGLASMMLGPVGWLYAGSFREAIPASAAWLAFAYVASHLPTLLLMPMLFVAMPASGIAGAMYAVRHNRQGKRARLFGARGGASEDRTKGLPPGR